MIYDAHLSMKLDYDIYTCQGKIYLKQHGNQHLIGYIGTSSIMDLRDAIEEYMP